MVIKIYYIINNQMDLMSSNYRGDDINQYLPDIIKYMDLLSVKFVKKLGEGTYGYVNLYRLQNKDKVVFDAALKVAKYDKQEIEYGKDMFICKDDGGSVGPEIYSYFTVTGSDKIEKMIIVMEPFDMSTFEFIKTVITIYNAETINIIINKLIENMLGLIVKMMKCGLLCWDIKTRNFVINLEGGNYYKQDVRMIDFGVFCTTISKVNVNKNNGLFLLIIFQLFFEFVYLFKFLITDDGEKLNKVMESLLSTFNRIPVFKNRSDYGNYIKLALSNKKIKTTFIYYYNDYTMSVIDVSINNTELIDIIDTKIKTLENIQTNIRRFGNTYQLPKFIQPTIKSLKEPYTSQSGRKFDVMYPSLELFTPDKSGVTIKELEPLDQLTPVIKPTPDQIKKIQESVAINKNLVKFGEKRKSRKSKKRKSRKSRKSKKRKSRKSRKSKNRNYKKNNAEV